MTGDYPRFRTAYSHDELVEHFLLTPTEQDLIAQCRGDVNRHGTAVLLKSLHYLGYFPESPQEVPPDVRNASHFPTGRGNSISSSSVRAGSSVSLPCRRHTAVPVYSFVSPATLKTSR